MKPRGWMIGMVGLCGLVLVAFTLIPAGPVRAGAVVTPPEDPEDEDTAAAQDESDRGPQAEGQQPAELRPRERFREEGRRRRGDRRPGDRSGDGSRRGREGRGGPGDFGALRDEPLVRMIDRVMGVLRDELPEWHDRLAKMRKHDPERFLSAMHRVLPVMREYVSLRQEHPELAETILEEFRIEGRLRSMGRAFREARGDEARQEEIQRDIVHLVQRQFELKMRRRMARMEEIARRLDRERERFERDKEMLPRQVADRVRQITRGQPEDSLRGRDGEPRRQRRDAFGDRPKRRPLRRR